MIKLINKYLTMMYNNNNPLSSEKNAKIYQNIHQKEHKNIVKLRRISEKIEPKVTKFFFCF